MAVSASMLNKMRDYLHVPSEDEVLDEQWPEREEAQVGLREEDRDNPWAICTASVGRKDKEKYEDCVKSVKGNKNEHKIRKT